jgi:hypothetical protein
MGCDFGWLILIPSFSVVLIFEAGSDFGQIGPTVSAAYRAAARSSAPAKYIIIYYCSHGK